MKVIGLISGTSMDGIDAALTEIKGQPPEIRIKLLDYLVHPYPSGLKERIREAASPTRSRVNQICHLNFYLGHLFTEAALSLIQKSGVKPTEIKLIGSHGQTIYHLPQPIGEPGKFGRIEIRSSLQIGEGAVIAEKTGITTITNFRARDLAAGGVGAPLLPYLHYLLFRNQQSNRVVINIGGISNLTFIPSLKNSPPSMASGSVEPPARRGGNRGEGVKLLSPPPQPAPLKGEGNIVNSRQERRPPRNFRNWADSVIAFDTGPGNLVIDGLIRKISRGKHEFDQDGQFARKGRLNRRLLDYLLSHEFISQAPPKAAERNTFGEDYLKNIRKIAKNKSISAPDLVRTATVCIAESITLNCRRFIFPLGRPETAIICGGGANNLFLLECLSQSLSGIRVTTTQEFGLDPKIVEAAGFALLAYETWHQRPGNLPRVTGAGKPVILGCIYPGN
ncbi:MAG: anhydro-N-acetylmuramic acid kinase [Proteobacteria bacterium]|nr:anhydro-N-acetylmuramic acid kinase [Pseudomonadota bacterium]